MDNERLVKFTIVKELWVPAEVRDGQLEDYLDTWAEDMSARDLIQDSDLIWEEE